MRLKKAITILTAAWLFVDLAVRVSGYNEHSQCNNITVTEQEVARFAFSNSLPWTRPVRDANLAVNVSISLTLIAINDVVEKDRIVKLTGYLTLAWEDQLHNWNETFPYVCLPVMVMPANLIWIPEIATINSESHYDLILSKNVERVRMFNNGTVNYRPGGTFILFCNFDLLYFPFDQQKCRLQLESWRYTKASQVLTITEPAVSLRAWIENEQWSWVAASGRKGKGLEDGFDHIDFEFSIRRKVGYYMMNVIIPSAIISLAQMAVFTLPVDEVMKIHISFTCLLAYTVFQLMIIADMPRTSDHIPLLSIYIDLSMAYICASMLCEGVVFICLRQADDKQHRRRVPNCLFTLAFILSMLLQVDKPPTPKERKSFCKKCNVFSSMCNCASNNEPSLKIASSSERSISCVNVDRKSTSPLSMAQLSPNWQTQFYQPIWEISRSNCPPKTPNDNIFPSDTDTLASSSNNKDAILRANNHPDDESYPHRRHNRTYEQARWQFVGDVIDRFTMTVYFLLIVATPVGMFGILPLLNDHYNVHQGDSS